MTVTIEKVDVTTFIVRCIIPENPPFKATMVEKTIERALECVRGMLEFSSGKAAENFLGKQTRKKNEDN